MSAIYITLLAAAVVLAVAAGVSWHRDQRKIRDRANGRTVKVTITADTSQFVAGLRRAAEAADELTGGHRRRRQQIAATVVVWVVLILAVVWVWPS